MLFIDGLQQAVSQFGKDVMSEQRLVNILSDFGAFENTALRNILEKAVKINVAAKLLLLEVEPDSFRILKINGIVDDMARVNGFQPELTRIVVRGMAFALGLLLDPSVQQPVKKTDTSRPETPATTAVSHVVSIAGMSINMIKVEKGVFSMGGTAEQGLFASFDEKPPVYAELNTYYIADTPVTQDLWETVTGDNPSHFKGPKLPVERVTWRECKRFIAKLNIMTGFEFRFPTEAEWEYAARGANKGKRQMFAGCGENELIDFVWFDANSGDRTHEVRLKKPNELGLYDMSGNINEWCSDWYANSYANNCHFLNPQGPDSGSYKVCRGGCWKSKPADCRVSKRFPANPDFRNSLIGFRLAATTL
jgi:formylglycine-generating enzyme required for sulfatase activity